MTGDVSNDMVNAQVAWLNSAFDPASFRFTLISVDRAANDSWCAFRHRSDATLRRCHMMFDPFRQRTEAHCPSSANQLISFSMKIDPVAARRKLISRNRLEASW